MLTQSLVIHLNKDHDPDISKKICGLWQAQELDGNFRHTIEMLKIAREDQTNNISYINDFFVDYEAIILIYDQTLCQIFVQPLVSRIKLNKID